MIPMHFILFYDLASDYLSRRGKFRVKHIELANKAYERGELVLAGALSDPVDKAVLIFNEARFAESFVKNDPYVLNGLVRSWHIRNWTTVVGEGSTPPQM
jgi:uncharacterized protein